MNLLYKITILKLKICATLLFLVFPLTKSYSQSDSTNTYNTTSYRFGGGFKIGGGYGLFTNSTKYLANCGTFNGGILFSYNRFIVDLEMMILNTTATSDHYNASYPIKKDSLNQLIGFGNTIGYILIDKRRFLTYPFVGIGYYQLSRSSDDDDDISGPGKAGYITGLQLDYKFGNTYGPTFMGSFIIGSRINYVFLNDYTQMNLSHLNFSLCFIAHIRGYRKIKN